MEPGGVSTHLRFKFKFLPPERDNGSEKKYYSKTLISITLFLSRSQARVSINRITKAIKIESLFPGHGLVWCVFINNNSFNTYRAYNICNGRHVLRYVMLPIYEFDWDSMVELSPQKRIFVIFYTSFWSLSRPDTHTNIYLLFRKSLTRIYCFLLTQ